MPPPFPNEILAEIFMYCNEDARFRLPRYSDIEDEMARFAHIPNTEQPSFAQVCSQWRAIALGCSRLWNNLAISWTVYKSKFSSINALIEAKTNLFDLWIKRTGIQPLSISFALDDPGYDKKRVLPRDIKATKAMTALVLPHLHRLQYLRFNGHLPTIAEFFKDIDSSKLPLLESVFLGDNTDCEDDSESWWFKDSFNGCQALRNLILDHHSFLGTHAQLSFPLTQLTHLHSSCELTPRQALSLLETCPQLEWAGLFVSARTLEIFGAIAFSSLKCFHLTADSVSVALFLPFLVLSDLQTFCLTHRDGGNYSGEPDDTILLSALDHFFKVSRPPTTTLSLSGNNRFCQDSMLVDFLVKLPHLENLLLSQNSTFFLGYGEGSKRIWLTKVTLRKFVAGKFLPRLKRLRLECPTGLNETILRDIVKKRRSGWSEDDEWARLDFLYVVLKEPLGSEAREELEDEGLSEGRVNYSYSLM